VSDSGERLRVVYRMVPSCRLLTRVLPTSGANNLHPSPYAVALRRALVLTAFVAGGRFGVDCPARLRWRQVLCLSASVDRHPSRCPFAAVPQCTPYFR